MTFFISDKHFSSSSEFMNMLNKAIIFLLVFHHKNQGNCKINRIKINKTELLEIFVIKIGINPASQNKLNKKTT